MTERHSSKTTALVLPGGGARGAFQVGVLKAIAELMPKGAVNPFGVISGTSAGAVNTVVLASKAGRFKVAVAELERVWGNFRCHHVYRTDHWTMLRSSLHWFAAIVTGGLVGMPKSLLDNSPLRALLSRNIRFPRIQFGLERDWLEAVAREDGCGQLHLDSGVQRFDAHRFYFTRGMAIRSHHFGRDLAEG